MKLDDLLTANFGGATGPVPAEDVRWVEILVTAHTYRWLWALMVGRAKSILWESPAGFNQVLKLRRPAALRSATGCHSSYRTQSGMSRSAATETSVAQLGAVIYQPYALDSTSRALVQTLDRDVVVFDGSSRVEGVSSPCHTHCTAKTSPLGSQPGGWLLQFRYTRTGGA